jgi:hypothetical protein
MAAQDYSTDVAYAKLDATTTDVTSSAAPLGPRVATHCDKQQCDTNDDRAVSMLMTPQAKSQTTTPQTAATPAPASQANPKPGPAPSPPCVDKHSLCSAYACYAGTTYCSRAWHNGWAVDNCPKACKLCA